MSTTKFSEFCIKGKREILTFTGEKKLVMFTLLKCGTSDEITDILDFTLRTFPDCMALDIGVTGSDGQDREHFGEWANLNERKRKPEAGECFGMLNTGLSRIADPMDQPEAPEVVSSVAAKAAELEYGLKCLAGLAEVSRMESGTTDRRVLEACEKEKARILALMDYYLLEISRDTV